MSAGPPRPSEPSSGMIVGGRNLPVAIAVGVVLGAALIAAIFTHPAAMLALIGLLLAVAIPESSRTLEDHDLRMDMPVLTVGAVGMLVGAYLLGPEGLVLGVALMFVTAVLLPLFDGDRISLAARLGRSAFFGLWVPFNAAFAVLLVRPDTLDASVHALTVLGSAVFTDVFAFAFGVAFGSRPVAPRVSPNKTWEGLLGGLGATSVLALVVVPLVSDALARWEIALLAFACGLFGFFGDLVQSMVKRDLGIKDFGAILPGHGGILDRVDGILLALPVGYALIQLLTG